MMLPFLLILEPNVALISNSLALLLTFTAPLWKLASNPAAFPILLVLGTYTCLYIPLLRDLVMRRDKGTNISSEPYRFLGSREMPTLREFRPPNHVVASLNVLTRRKRKFARKARDGCRH